jgi:hypothetical protein
MAVDSAGEGEAGRGGGEGRWVGRGREGVGGEGTSDVI